MRTFGQRLLTTVSLMVALLVGILVGYNHRGPAMPTCAEDEVIWWTADNVRGCVHYEDMMYEEVCGNPQVYGEVACRRFLDWKADPAGAYEEG